MEIAFVLDNWDVTVMLKQTENKQFCNVFVDCVFITLTYPD